MSGRMLNCHSVWVQVNEKMYFKHIEFKWSDVKKKNMYIVIVIFFRQHITFYF